MNPKVARILEEQDILRAVPIGVNVSNIVKRSPVRNLSKPFLHIEDASVFTPAVNFFNEAKKKYGVGRYTNAIKGTTQYKQFWKEETNRCLNGYEPIVDGVPCGLWITGAHYFYLNYCLIERRVKDRMTGLEVKRDGFPDFLLMDLYYFWELDINENPLKYGKIESEKKGMIVAKARRKGWSFKNASVCVHKYTFFPKSYCVIASFLKPQAAKTFSMALTMSNHLNKYTEFSHKRAVDKNDEIVSGRKRKINGQEVVEGFQSCIKLMSFKDSDFKSVGNSATIFLFEEAGTFENLIEVYQLSEPLWKDGDISTGIPLIFGTGGDMSNVTKGFAEMFNNPGVWGLAEYENIYDENTEGMCGMFIDEMWYRPCTEEHEGKFYEGVDSNGNPNRWAAEVNLDKERERKKKSKDKKKYIITITQKCKTPKEAFMVPEGSIFPMAELYDRLSKLKADENYKYIGTPGELVFTENNDSINGVSFTPDVEGKLSPLYEYPSKVGTDRDGAVIIYERPVLVNGEVPSDMYYIGHDPYAMNTETGESLGSAYVMMSPKYFQYGGEKIVAEYVGRPSGGNSMTIYNMNMEKLSLFYGGAKIMYEVSTGQGDVLNHFTRRKKLALLAMRPILMLSNSTRSKANHTYGCSLSDVNKGDLEQHTYDWLLTERGETADGKKYTNIDLIPSKGLLEELIMYNRDRNCDRVSSLFMLMVIMGERINRFNIQNTEVDAKPTKMDWLKNNPKVFPGKGGTRHINTPTAYDLNNYFRK